MKERRINNKAFTKKKKQQFKSDKLLIFNKKKENCDSSKRHDLREQHN